MWLWLPFPLKQIKHGNPPLQLLTNGVDNHFVKLEVHPCSGPQFTNFFFLDSGFMLVIDVNSLPLFGCHIHSKINA